MTDQTPEQLERGAFSDEQVREAITSIALTHPKDCSCDVCRAVGGDLLAFVRICAGRREGHA